MSRQQIEFLLKLTKAWVENANKLSDAPLALLEGDWPPRIYALLVDYMTMKSDESLCNLVISALELRCFSALDQALAVGALLSRKKISAAFAFDLLSSLQVQQGVDDDRLQKLQDVMWLLKEDRKDRVMAVEDDDLFLTALCRLSKEK